MTLKQYDYETIASFYDVLELNASNNYEKINDFLDVLFKKRNVSSVLDVTCGTGAQAIGLAKRGYKVTASDLSENMLAIAKKKAVDLPIPFHKEDIKTVQLGTFDAVISIFNAIAHFSKEEFEEILDNLGKNLKSGGLYVFDIFNVTFFSGGGFVEHEFIDRSIEHEGTKYVRFNKNTLDKAKGVMTVHQKSYIQKGLEKALVLKEDWDMQLYTAAELKMLLEKHGFKVLETFGGPGVAFEEEKSVSVWIVAEKV
tara:strand:+ start:6977 stop:7741 length:765 start_codon:yes stop_codon:yes gene_type:complete